MEGMKMKSKSIRILSILILLLSMVVLGNGFRGFKDGWNSAGRDLDKKPEGKIHRVDVPLNPVVAYSLPDTLQLEDNRKIPYQIGSVALGMKTDKAYELYSVIIGLIFTPVSLLLIIWAGLSFFHFIRDVQRQQIFIRSNVKRLRVICWMLLFVGIMKNLFAGMDYFLLLKDSHVSFPGYQIAGFEFQYSIFFLALLFGLFAEIFALGVKLKEEQDLTV